MNLFDTSQAPKAHPIRIVRGDYQAWRNRNLVADYPTDSYSLKYVFRLEGEPAKEKSVSSSVDNGEYLFELAGSDSADWDVGLWFWQLYVIRTSDSARVTVDHGSTNIIASLDDDSTDPRAHPRKMVALIKAAVLGRATKKQLDTLSYSLDVESSATRDPMVLNKWLNFWEARLVRANRLMNARRGKPHSGNIKARF